MKCLRCGKEMKNENECSCGHFYENNLNKHGKGKKKQKKDNPFKDLMIMTLLLVIFAVVMLIITNLLDYYDNDKKSDYCEKVCEGSIYTIRGTNCVCEDGTKYPIK